MSNLINNMSDEQALKNFLLDIDCLDKLNPWTNKFNLFDVLKISRTEIRHSNMLAWLLDPNENHGLKDYVIRGLIERIVKTSAMQSLDVFDVLMMDFYEFSVMREWNNIDVMLVSDKSKFVICIENKVYSSEHSNQLNRYRKIIDKHYSKYRKIFLFLTPTGYDASDNENWASISYSDFLDIITLSMQKTSVFPDVELLINNYIETVRWHIVGDENLVRICNDIYKKHKKALDLIFDNKADSTQEVSTFVKDKVKEILLNKPELGFVVRKESNNVMHFSSNNLIAKFPDSENITSDWKTNFNIAYYINHKYNNINFALQLNKGSLTDAECEQKFGKLIKIEKPNDNTTNWTWKILKAWPVLKYNTDSSLEEIQDALESRINSIIVKICEYEEGLIKKLEK